MKQFDVYGMSCSACSARVEKAVSALDNVTSCSVNLLTNTLAVEGSATNSEIISAVVRAGYSAQIKGAAKIKTNSPVKHLRNRLVWSLGFLLLLMYFSMGYVMWSWPLPNVLVPFVGYIQLALTIPVIAINYEFFTSGFKALMHLSPNMDTLVSLGSAVSFVYSVVNLFLSEHSLHNLYFESTAMILTLITLGKLLEAISKGKTTSAIKSLMDLSPKTATLLVDGKEKIVPVEEVKINDIFVVKAGESIPVDGIVIEGESAVDQSALTGESIPVEKGVNSTLSSATINQTGFLKCRATRVGEDTTLSQIIKMVSDASATKAPIAKVADKVSGIFVPTVILISLVTLVAWLIFDKPLAYALTRAVSVLVISCPCALGLATPVAIMVGSGVGARNGILFKTALSLEQTGRATAVMLDKTGTVTKGTPTVTDIIPNKITETELLKSAYSLEIKSSHPISLAIINKCDALGIKGKPTESFNNILGKGIEGKLNNSLLRAGNEMFIQNIPAEFSALSDSLAKEGKTPLFFSENGNFIGIIAVADVIKEDSAEGIKELKKMNLSVHMLTGDNLKTANAIGKKAGIENIIAEVLPADKQAEVQKLQKLNKVIMVGDGINDAPALTAADVGIAIGAGTDIAIDSADVVLMKGSVKDVASAIKLSKATLRNIHQNLFWAFIYNVIGIPLAAGIFGLSLDPMFAAGAMSLSSVCVVTNALRLNFIKLKGETKMEKVTLNVEGMMCPHCEARVRDSLLSASGVTKAEVSHQKGEAVVEFDPSVTNAETLKNVITTAGYTVK